MSAHQNKSALEALAQSPDLARLQTLLHTQQTRFNLFEAMGSIRQELRHSDFLAFLLNPQANHGFGDAFLKQFLSVIVGNTPITPTLPASAIASLDLSQTQVRREWNNIDLFLVNDHLRFAVVIENKVYSGEHGDQLKRYLDIMKSHGYTSSTGWTVIPVYLTPHGGKASHTDYRPLGYETVCALLETFGKERAEELNPEVRMALRHYTQLVRKHLVGDPEITKLCRDIYTNHKLALDLLFRERGSADEQQQRRALLLNFVSSDPLMTRTKNVMWQGINYVRFHLTAWDNEAGLLEGTGSGNYGRLLTFEFINQPNGLVDIVVQVNPGPVNTREKLLALARTQSWFLGVPETLTTYTAFYRRPLLTEDDYPADQEAIDVKLTEEWQRFLATDYPHFVNLIEPGSFPATKNS